VTLEELSERLDRAYAGESTSGRAKAGRDLTAGAAVAAAATPADLLRSLVCGEVERTTDAGPAPRGGAGDRLQCAIDVERVRSPND
jgi:hypothetical protein